MPETLSLFETPDLEWKLRLSERLSKLASERKHFFGASSWKYEGWLDTIYTRQRYSVRGRFSRKQFEQDCLTEYAEVFPIVSGDFAFYQFPEASFWQRLFAQVDAPFQFAFKVPEDITLPVFPNHPRYGVRAGLPNPYFLSSELLKTSFLDRLTPHRDRISLLIFEFASITGRAMVDASRFAEALSRFFSVLPKSFRYAVEIRDPRLFAPAYLRALQENGVAHVFNSWTDMPAIQEQMRHSEAFTAPFTAVRALLTPGRQYEQSVSLFSPYSEVREPSLMVRSALRELVIRARNRVEPVFMFVNNRLEGFAPGTIAAIVEEE